MIDREALKKAVDAYHAAGNGYAWFQKGTNWPAPIEAAITAYLTSAGEGAVPVASVVWHDPASDLTPPQAGKMIDASMAWMDSAPIGTKLYDRPSHDVIMPEPVYKAVERILDEESAWVARPSPEITQRIALAATVAAEQCLRSLPHKDMLQAIIDEALAAAPNPPRQDGATSPKRTATACPDCNGNGRIETGAMEQGPGGWGYEAVECISCGGTGEGAPSDE